MFDGFELSTIAVGDGRLRVRRSGDGLPVLLLHGHPQTHLMWHGVAPVLAQRHTVICADLTGYGGSFKPETTVDHEPYSKRAMGQLQIKLMRRLGFEHFAVVGHDRGARVAYRMALDHPEIIDRLAVLDIVPTGDMWRRADREFGLAYWHWYFLAQPYDLPERIIATDPEAFYGRRWLPFFHPDAVADYRQALATPGTIHAICEDYRAAAGIDREHDEMDRRRQRRIQCPVLVLWGRHDGRSLEHWFDVVGLWRQWADDIQGRALDCGHHLPEELPDETAAELLSFLQPPAT